MASYGNDVVGRGKLYQRGMAPPGGDIKWVEMWVFVMRIFKAELVTGGRSIKISYLSYPCPPYGGNGG